jgi:tetratricopeptide (TPR) repeat protein
MRLIIVLFCLQIGSTLWAQPTLIWPQTCIRCQKKISSPAEAKSHQCTPTGTSSGSIIPTKTPEQIQREKEAARREQQRREIREEAENENDLGADCYYKGDWDCAERYFKKAVALDPDFEDAQINLQKVQKILKERNDKIAAEERRRQEEVQRRKSEDERIQREKDQNEREELKRRIDSLEAALQTNRIIDVVEKDRERYRGQLQKLMNDVGKIKVPPPPVPRRIHEGVLLGLFNTDAVNAITDLKKQVRSPYTGKEYKPDEFFATSDNLSAKELLRGVIDNSYMGDYTLNTQHGKELVKKLYGTQFDRLIAHSNGATVAEALIRGGVIKVDELNIAGGDRSLINYFGLNELISSGKVKRVVVWLNPGDLIPYGSSAGLLSPLPGAKDQYFRAAKDYILSRLPGGARGADAKVEYRFLTGFDDGQTVVGGDVFHAHGLEVYTSNMSKYFIKNSDQKK